MSAAAADDPVEQALRELEQRVGVAERKVDAMNRLVEATERIAEHTGSKVISLEGQVARYETRFAVDDTRAAGWQERFDRVEKQNEKSASALTAMISEQREEHKEYVKEQRSEQSKLRWAIGAAVIGTFGTAILNWIIQGNLAGAA